MVVAVSEFIGDCDPHLVSLEFGRAVEPHPSSLGREFADGRRRNHGQPTGRGVGGGRRRGAEGRRTRRRVIAAELIVGLAPRAQVDHAAADVPHRHVGMPAGHGPADHRDDPVVAKHVVAVNPVRLLTCGSDRRGILGGDRQHLRRPAGEGHKQAYHHHGTSHGHQKPPQEKDSEVESLVEGDEQTMRSSAAAQAGA